MRSKTHTSYLTPPPSHSTPLVKLRLRTPSGLSSGTLRLLPVRGTPSQPGTRTRVTGKRVLSYRLCRWSGVESWTHARVPVGRRPRCLHHHHLLIQESSSSLEHRSAFKEISVLGVETPGQRVVDVKGEERGKKKGDKPTMQRKFFRME